MNFKNKNQKQGLVGSQQCPPDPQPIDCTAPSSYTVLDSMGSPLYEVTFLGVVPVTEGYRWDYQITNINAQNALSNWVLELEGCFSDFECFVGEIYPASTTDIPIPTKPGDCLFPSSNPNFPCSITDPCTNVVGLKFDNLNPQGEPELKPGTTQRFSFIIPENLPAEPACFQLKFGTMSRCGEICAPACVCDNPCICEEDNNFTCDVIFPDCFTLGGTEEEVRVAYCIGDVGECVMDGTCEVLDTINVCNTNLQCCVPVQRWRQEFDFQVIFNVPFIPLLGSGACVDEQVFACCQDEGTATQNCFTCIGDYNVEPPCVEPDCENTEIIVTGLTPIEDRTGTIIGVTIEYSFVTPPCANEVIDG